MNTLLTIINQPEKSGEFIKYVIKMAESLQSDIRLLYVQNPDYYPFGTPGTTGTATTQVQANLEKMSKDAVAIMKKHIDEISDQIPNDRSVSISTEIASLRSAVDKYVSENKADMVVLKDEDNAGHLSQNAINMDIIRYIDCPVWIIPHDIAYKPFKEIVYATDYKEEDIETLNRLIRLTGRLSPKILALHITDNLDFDEKIRKAGFLDTVHKKTSYDKIDIKALVEQKDEDLAELFNDFTSDSRADLIVLLKENRHFLERIFKPSATRKIIKQTQLPVLIYHERN